MLKHSGIHKAKYTKQRPIQDKRSGTICNQSGPWKKTDNSHHPTGEEGRGVARRPRNWDGHGTPEMHGFPLRIWGRATAFHTMKHVLFGIICGFYLSILELITPGLAPLAGPTPVEPHALVVTLSTVIVLLSCMKSSGLWTEKYIRLPLHGLGIRLKFLDCAGYGVLRNRHWNLCTSVVFQMKCFWSRKD